MNTTAIARHGMKTHQAIMNDNATAAIKLGMIRTLKKVRHTTEPAGAFVRIKKAQIHFAGGDPSKFRPVNSEMDAPRFILRDEIFILHRTRSFSA